MLAHIIVLIELFEGSLPSRLYAHYDIQGNIKPWQCNQYWNILAALQTNEVLCYSGWNRQTCYVIWHQTMTGRYSGTVLNYWICLLGLISLQDDTVTVGVSHQAQEWTESILKCLSRFFRVSLSGLLTQCISLLKA